MSIFDQPLPGGGNTPPGAASGAGAVAGARSKPWQDCYPAWAARGLIPLRQVGELFNKNGEAVQASGKEPIHHNWQSLPAQREAAGESQLETFSDIEHELERGRNIGMVIPEGTV